MPTLNHDMKFIGATLTALCMIATASSSPAADDAHAATYLDLDGKPQRLPGRDECRALVLFFVAHDCPISNSYAPEIARICREFTPRGAAFRVVYSERGLDLAEAARHAKEFGYPCPAIVDRDLKLAARTGATVTPEAAVLSPEGALLYLGRIDDLYAAYGKKRAQPRHRDLRAAIDAVVAGRAVPQARTPSIGCTIFFGTQSPGEE